MSPPSRASLTAVLSPSTDGREGNEPDNPPPAESVSSRRRQLTISAHTRRITMRYLRGLVGLRAPARHETGQAAAARGAARGVLLTPWFAAGTGFVLAAGMYLYAPHADLRFPNPLQNKQPCAVKSCKPAHGAVAGAPGAPIPDQSNGGTHGGAARKTPASGHRSNPASGLTFSYQVQWQEDNTFGVQITVTGKRTLTSWRLRFTMRGASNIHVVGASFAPMKAGDGGVATPLSWGGGGPGPGDQATSPPGGEDEQSTAGGPIIVFTVYGSGTPHKPVRCRFDGARCTFS